MASVRLIAKPAIYSDENYDCENNCIVEFDCNGDCGGYAEIDNCDDCVGGLTELQHVCKIVRGSGMVMWY